MENNTLLINGEEVGKVISLTVHLDGEVELNILGSRIVSSQQSTVNIGGEDFLKVCTFKGDTQGILLPITYDKKEELEKFFELWGLEVLEELKDSRWREFLRCWSVVLDCIRENVILDKHEVTYKIEPHDLSDCGGGLSVWMEIFVTRGIGWDDDFNWSMDLNHTMFDKMFCEGIYDSDIFSGIIVNFRPKYSNREDFKSLNK